MPVELDATSKKWILPALQSVGDGVPDLASPGKVAIRFKAGKAGGVFTVQNPAESWAIAETMASRLKSKVPTVEIPKVRSGFVIPKVIPGALVVFHVIQTALDLRVRKFEEDARALGLEPTAFETASIVNRYREDRGMIIDMAGIVQTVTQLKAKALAIFAMKKTKTKHPTRIRIHGWSRREGKTVKDFKRKSPRVRS